MAELKSFFKPERKKILFAVIYFFIGWFFVGSFAITDCIGGCPRTYLILFPFLAILESFRLFVPGMDLGQPGYVIIIVLVLALLYSYLISCIIFYLIPKIVTKRKDTDVEKSK
jgi:hypothetical protein